MDFTNRINYFSKQTMKRKHNRGSGRIAEAARLEQEEMDRKVAFAKFILSRQSNDQAVNDKWEAICKQIIEKILKNIDDNVIGSPRLSICMKNSVVQNFLVPGPDKDTTVSMLERLTFSFEGLKKDTEAKETWLASMNVGDAEDEEEKDEMWLDFVDSLDNIKEDFLPFIWRRFRTVFLQVHSLSVEAHCAPTVEDEDADIGDQFASLADVLENVVKDPKHINDVSICSADYFGDFTASELRLAGRKWA